MVRVGGAGFGWKRGFGLRQGLAWASASLAVALMGPFGTHESLAALPRLLVWAAIIALGLVLREGFGQVIRRSRLGRGLAAQMIAAVLLAISLGPMIWAICRHCAAVAGGPPPALIEVVLVVLAVCCAIIALRRQLAPRWAVTGAAGDASPGGSGRAAPKPDAPMRPDFLNRMDRHLPGAVIRVSADDHYLHVHTEAGAARLFMRFRDAMVELDALPGFRIHRSHWVAAHAVLRLRVEGRRHVLDLCDGTSLPVSQAYLGRLRAAGLADQRGIGNRTGDAPIRIASAPWPINPDSSGPSENRPPV
jgi:hypothetical protein